MEILGQLNYLEQTLRSGTVFQGLVEMEPHAEIPEKTAWDRHSQNKDTSVSKFI